MSGLRESPNLGMMGVAGLLFALGIRAVHSKKQHQAKKNTQEETNHVSEINRTLTWTSVSVFR